MKREEELATICFEDPKKAAALLELLGLSTKQEVKMPDVVMELEDECEWCINGECTLYSPDSVFPCSPKKPCSKLF